MNYIIKIFEKTKDWSLKNWANYVLAKDVYLVTAFPIALGLVFVSGFASLGYFILFLILFFNFFRFDGQRIIVAEGDPASFIAGERIDDFFKILFFVIATVFISFMYTLLAIGLYLQAFTQLKGFTFPIPVLYVFEFLAITMLCTSSPVLINGIESSNLIILTRHRRPSWSIPDYFPSERIRARARFVVTSDSLAHKPRKKAMKDFLLFNEGIKIYNEHLKTKFGLVLCEPERFFLYAKFKAFFTDDSSCVMNSLHALEDLAKKESEQPCDFVRLLKEMMNEPTSDSEISKDVNIEGKPVRKIIRAKQHELLTNWIAPLVITIVGGAILYWLHIIL